MEIHHSILYKPVINLFGCPNSGKSTLASYLFAICKKNGAKCEMIGEVAKDIVYEKNKFKIWNQPYVFGNQLNRLIRVIEDVDFIITDSPILLSIVYTPECFSELEALAVQAFSYFDNYSYILPLHKDYCASGRRHKKSESEILSAKIKLLAHEHSTNNRVVDLETHDLEQNAQDIINHAQLSNFFKGPSLPARNANSVNKRSL